MKTQRSSPPAQPDMSAWAQDKCPHCNSQLAVKVHRTWWQKLLHPHENRYLCRNCQHGFWRPQ